MIISARDVEEAGAELVIAPGDVVTPLARERAQALGVELRSGTGGGSPRDPVGDLQRDHPPAPARVSAGPLTLPNSAAGAPTALQVSADTLNTLYRRGAPVARELDVSPTPTATPTLLQARPSAAAGSPPRRPRAAVIGAGHVGSIAAMRLAEADLLDEVVLVDVVDGLAAGVALDLWHSAELNRFSTKIRGTSNLAEIVGCNYVIITAGRARKPGMTRTDLTQANAEIVGPVAEAVARFAPYAVIVVVTNPLEEMTHLAQLKSRFPASRVLGMAGVLDTARFKALVALTGVGRPDEIEAIALGSHGPEMVIPLSQASVGGRALADVVEAATLSAITDRARDSGAEVVSLLKTGSAYFAPGQSAAHMVTAMISGRDEVMACAVVPDGEYGLKNTRVGLPVRLGPDGLASIVVLDLTAPEQAALEKAAANLAERISEVT